MMKKTEYKITEERGKFVVKSHVANSDHSFIGGKHSQTFVNFVAECETMWDAERVIGRLMDMVKK